MQDLRLALGQMALLLHWSCCTISEMSHVLP